ncbi:uncharacterized protein YbjT (DUF2867 family) [Aurantimicrobium minutum]|uniref:SDR family oxidoreductase n=1 Tax=Aurantimicrobium minutum TaxID=708131 RepID=UPI0024767868|nr:SDR family oxidoreductase [Aurantimicrobium minutum]MDH6533256.1 uncharacterized protein YbjT (DUF2867 family) [Aurantimicrobium minutum]
MALKRALVTGATGYIGGRLVPRLLEAGFTVRVLVRNAEKLKDVPWRAQVEIHEGDLLDAAAVERACHKIDVLYYLVHAMGQKGDFESKELQGAHHVAESAKAAGVSRIVYLGGLHPSQGELSKHLRSRAEVGQILLDSGVPTAALQAGVIIGSGSTSFEMIRHLTDVLPVMTAPKWVGNLIQPIAVRDVMYYLIKAADLPPTVNRTIDIGGPEVLKYSEMMNGYAVEAGMKERAILKLPVLTPYLASQWVNLVTPIPRTLAVPIIASLQHDCIMNEHDVDSLIPPPAEGLLTYRRSVHLALGKMKEGDIETSWQNASVEGAPSDPLPSDPEWAGHRVYIDLKQRDCDAPVEDLWALIEGIGGENGWYSLPIAWAARGFADKLVGGVGLRRGRINPVHLRVGEAVDWWRVERIDHGSFLRLRAEMKVPGLAWLELTATALPDGTSHYTQRAIFFPRGLGGRLYWLSILPAHGIIFNGMANKIVATAEQRFLERKIHAKLSALS